MLALREPLVGAEAAGLRAPSPFERSLIFAVLSLCSSILWNMLLLSVALLVSPFGEGAISIAAMT